MRRLCHMVINASRRTIPFPGIYSGNFLASVLKEVIANHMKKHEHFRCSVPLTQRKLIYWIEKIQRQIKAHASY